MPSGGGLDTAVAALERASPPQAGEQRSYILKPAPDGTLVVYQSFNGRFASYFGYAYMTQAGMGWQIHEAGSGGRAGPPEINQPIYLSMSVPRIAPAQTIVVGLLLDERVRFVRVTLTNGQSKTDTVVDNLTGIVLAPQNTVCRIQLLDQENKLLFDFDLAENPVELYLAPDIVESAKRECV